jgi:ferredoxin
MQNVQQILFIAVSLVAIWLFTKKVIEIRRNINLGRDEDISDNKTQRWRNVLLLAFGQKKMFRNPLVAVLHFFVYAGFIIINIEVLEIILDGVLGKHRIFVRLGVVYDYLIHSFEILAVLVILGCAIFLIRRNIIKLKRFISHDLDGWPRSDANYILITEIILMLLFLTLNASDTLLIKRSFGVPESSSFGFVVSEHLHPMLKGLSNQSLEIIERSCWWLHIVGIYTFLNYLPYSKHLHIILAFPNTYYGRLEPLGEMENMPAVQNEVLYAMKPELAPPAGDGAQSKNAGSVGFGAKDVADLSWKNLLDAYSCTECGRCTAACPPITVPPKDNWYKGPDGRHKKKH